jgi:hypothetical protein
MPFLTGYIYRERPVITNIMNDPNVTSIGGSWKLSGDQLTITVDPKYKPQPGRGVKRIDYFHQRKYPDHVESYDE